MKPSERLQAIHELNEREVKREARYASDMLAFVAIAIAIGCIAIWAAILTGAAS